MRLWILVPVMIWGLIACSSRGVTPPPLPTNSPVELTVDDITIDLVTATGWQTYISNNRITLSHQADVREDVVVNIWIPDIRVSNYATINQATFDIADAMENEQRVYVTQPTATTWQTYDASYFLASNDEPQTSMIVVVKITDVTAIALNIRGISTDFASIRDELAQTFETFTVNDTQLGNDIFLDLPDSLMLPARSPEAALDPSAEP